jgi:hypothetical protein
MRKFLTKNKKQKGYAILFTVVIVSAISVITAGLSNAAYKQLILSSLAKDSQLAFYEADTAGDCALYADLVEYPKLFPSDSEASPSGIFSTLDSSWSCGGLDLTIVPVIAGDPSSGYSLTPPQEDSSNPCFRIDVTKDTSSVFPLTKTTITAKGYNICRISNLRTVERKIKITHEE